MSLRLFTWSTLGTALLAFACSQAAQPDTQGSVAVVIESAGAPSFDAGEIEISGLDQRVYQRVALPRTGELNVALKPGAYQVAWSPLPKVDGSGELQHALRPASSSQVLLVAPGQVTSLKLRLLEAPELTETALQTAANESAERSLL